MMSQQQHLRLQVMMSIRHPEEYYQQALRSRGVDHTQLTHDEIAVWKATIKAIEADCIIHAAENSPILNVDAVVETLSIRFKMAEKK